MNGVEKLITKEISSRVVLLSSQSVGHGDLDGFRCYSLVDSNLLSCGDECEWYISWRIDEKKTWVSPRVWNPLVFDEERTEWDSHSIKEVAVLFSRFSLLTQRGWIRRTKRLISKMDHTCPPQIAENTADVDGKGSIAYRDLVIPLFFIHTI